MVRILLPNTVKGVVVSNRGGFDSFSALQYVFVFQTGRLPRSKKVDAGMSDRESPSENVMFDFSTLTVVEETTSSAEKTIPPYPVPIQRSRRYCKQYIYHCGWEYCLRSIFLSEFKWGLRFRPGQRSNFTVGVRATLSFWLNIF